MELARKKHKICELNKCSTRDLSKNYMRQTKPKLLERKKKVQPMKENRDFFYFLFYFICFCDNMSVECVNLILLPYLSK